MNAKIIGSNIKRIRIEKGITQTELSKKTDISNVYISNIENGVKNNPSAEILEKIADALDVNFNELLQSPKDKNINDIASDLVRLKEKTSNKATVAGLIFERLKKEKILDENFVLTAELKDIIEDAIRLDAKLNNNLKGSE